MDGKSAMQCRGNANIEAALVGDFRRNAVFPASVKVNIDRLMKMIDQLIGSDCLIVDFLLYAENPAIEEALCLGDLHRSDVFLVP